VWIAGYLLSTRDMALTFRRRTDAPPNSDRTLNAEV